MAWIFELSPFGDRVGDRMTQVGNDVLQVPLEHLRYFDDRLEPAAGVCRRLDVS